jgi:hypothetical protein
MKRLFEIFRHRSLSLSLVALLFALLATSLLPEHHYRIEHQGTSYFAFAVAIVVGGLSTCAFSLANLIRDSRSGYPSFRCSLATLLLALACGPTGFLAFLLVGRFH